MRDIDGSGICTRSQQVIQDSARWVSRRDSQISKDIERGKKNVTAPDYGTLAGPLSSRAHIRTYTNIFLRSSFEYVRSQLFIRIRKRKRLTFDIIDAATYDARSVKIARLRDDRVAPWIISGFSVQPKEFFRLIVRINEEEMHMHL